MEKLALKGIHIYPIKSIAGVSLQKSIAGERGLDYDRRWMLIDVNNQFITQRQHHEMALIDLRIDEDHMIVSHRMKNLGSVQIPLEVHEGEQIQSTVWSDHVKVISPRTMADGWFSEALHTKCRLVYMPNDSDRQIDPKYVSKSMNTSLSDGYPYLLANKTSLLDIGQKAGIDLEMQRFRPNFIVETKTPFEEDSWRRIEIGDSVFKLVKPCARCVMITIDPMTGKAGKEPLKTMSTYRKKDNKILFGQNMIAEKEGLIQVGDSVKLI